MFASFGGFHVGFLLGFYLGFRWVPCWARFGFYLGLVCVLFGFHSGSTLFLCEFYVGILFLGSSWFFVGFVFHIWLRCCMCLASIWVLYGFDLAFMWLAACVYVVFMWRRFGFDLGSVCVLCVFYVWLYLVPIRVLILFY